MRRRRQRVLGVPVPPEHIRRFVACEWGWDGPSYVDGRLVLGYHEAHSRYLEAWSAWMDNSGCDLTDWFDHYGGPR